MLSAFTRTTEDHMAQFLLIALISAGAIVALQGLLTMRGRRPVRVTAIERPLINALALKDATQVAVVLGRLRLVYGLFFVVIGVWGLAT